MTATLPGHLDEVVEDFRDLPGQLRLETLLDYAGRVPELPARLAGDPGALERVQECQTPFFVATELDDDQRVTLWFEAPPEAPTTRGFAGILSEGLNGATAEEVLATPDDFYVLLGLAEVVSPLRLRGISAILGRIKRQVRARLAEHARRAPAPEPG